MPKRLSREQVLPSAANPLLSSIAGLSGSPLPPSMLGYLPGLPPGLLPQLGPGMRPMLPIPEIYQNLLPPVSTAPLPGGKLSFQKYSSVKNQLVYFTVFF